MLIFSGLICITSLTFFISLGMSLIPVQSMPFWVYPFWPYNVRFSYKELCQTKFSSSTAQELKPTYPPPLNPILFISWWHLCLVNAFSLEFESDTSFPGWAVIQWFQHLVSPKTDSTLWCLNQHWAPWICYAMHESYLVTSSVKREWRLACGGIPRCENWSQAILVARHDTGLTEWWGKFMHCSTPF
jgi:hypothetical protein